MQFYERHCCTYASGNNAGFTFQIKILQVPDIELDDKITSNQKPSKSVSYKKKPLEY